MDQPDPMPVEELIQALHRVLLVEPGAKAFRHPHGIGILTAAGKYAGVAGLPPMPQEDKLSPLTHDWNDLPPSLQNRILDGVAQAKRGETIDRGDFSQYLVAADLETLPETILSQDCVVCGAAAFIPCDADAHQRTRDAYRKRVVLEGRGGELPIGSGEFVSPTARRLSEEITRTLAEQDETGA